LEGNLAERLGEYLVESGMITEKQLDTVLERQVMMGGRLGTNLIELGYIGEEQLVQFLSKKLNIPSTQPQEFEAIPADVIQLIPAHLAEKFGAIPLMREKKSLKVAMVNPLDLEAIDSLGFATGCNIRPCLATEARVQYALEQYYHVVRGVRYVSILPDERCAKTAEGEKQPNNDVSTPGSVRDRPMQHKAKAGLSQPDLDSALDQLKHQLISASDREEVIESLLDFFKTCLDRAIFFVVKNGQLLGWKGHCPGLDPAEVVGLQISLNEPSLLRDAIEKKECLTGSKPPLKVLEVQPCPDAVAMPLVLEGLVIGLVYADNALLRHSIPKLDLLEKVMTKASMALKILILKSKILKL
jgi:hypothetical protein